MAVTNTVGTGDYIRPYKNRIQIKHFGEAASQTFVKGEPLIMDSASTESRVKVASNQPTARIVGFAAADASGVTGALIPVWLATPEAQFRVVGKAAQAMDDSDLGVGLALLKDATNVIWYLDNTDTTHDAMVPMYYVPPSVQGDFQGYYVARIAAAAGLYTATI